MWNLSTNASAFLLASGIIAVAIGLTAAGVLVVNRFFPRVRFDRETSDFGQIFGGAIGTMFALIFAMVTVAVWQNYDRVSSGVGDEANCIHNIYRYLESYPPKMRDETHALLRTYVETVINKEWLELKHGHQDPEALRLITEVNARITAYRPSMEEIPLHQEMLAQVSKYRGLRHDRVRSAASYLDISMWFSLGAGSLILLIFCSVWEMPDLRQHLTMAAALGGSLGIIFYLMLVYNHPFVGPGAIDPAPFQDLLDNHWNNK